MKITFLGTGTSQGIPVIGCGCAVCQSTDKRDKRLRVSVLIETGDKTIVATERDGVSSSAHKDGLLLVTPTDRATGRRHVKELNRIIIQRIN